MKVKVLPNKLEQKCAILSSVYFQYVSDFGSWSKVMTVMILNIDDLFRTYNIRSIILFEDDFNFAHKLYFSSKLMKILETSGVLPQEQHGVRSVQELIDMGVLRSLLFNCVINTRSNGVLRYYYA